MALPKAAAASATKGSWAAESAAETIAPVSNSASSSFAVRSEDARAGQATARACHATATLRHD